jgi:hypothetical protein
MVQTIPGAAVAAVKLTIPVKVVLAVLAVAAQVLEATEAIQAEQD